MSFATRKTRVRTLRGRLTLWQCSLLAASLLVFAVLAYGALSRNLYGHHDDELAKQSAELIAALADGPLDEARIRRVLSTAEIGSRLVMIRDGRGDILYRDPALESIEPAVGRHDALVHAAMATPESPRFFTVALERSGETRFICAPLRQSNAYLQIGDSLGDVRATLTATARSCLPLIPVVLAVSSFGGWLIARRALAPMQSIGTTLQEIHATDLSRRIVVQPHDEELQGLVRTLNQLLDRLERAFGSLRQFAGDASHLIQTPLTVMKGTLEAALRDRSRTGTDETLLEELKEEATGISNIVAQLREFALADAPVHAAERVDLSLLVNEIAEIISALGELKGVHVENLIEQNVTAPGDALRLKQMLLNLGDNAVKFTPAAGRVVITLRRVEADALITVEDAGVGIPADEVQHLLGRNDGRGTEESARFRRGLGLAIVRRIVVVHGGSLEVQSALGRGSVFAVRLPVNRPVIDRTPTDDRQ